MSFADFLSVIWTKDSIASKGRAFALNYDVVTGCRRSRLQGCPWDHEELYRESTKPTSRPWSIHSTSGIFNSFILSLVYSFIHSFIRPFILSIIHSSFRSFIHPFNHPSFHSFILSFIHLSIHSFNHLFIHPFIHSFILYHNISLGCSADQRTRIYIWPECCFTTWIFHCKWNPQELSWNLKLAALDPGSPSGKVPGFFPPGRRHCFLHKLAASHSNCWVHGTGKCNVVLETGTYITQILAKGKPELCFNCSFNNTE